MDRAFQPLGIKPRFAASSGGEVCRICAVVTLQPRHVRAGPRHALCCGAKTTMLRHWVRADRPPSR